MNSPEKRLDAVTSALTARERARIGLRWWVAGDEESEDKRLVELMPPDQKEEFHRLVDAVTAANNEFYHVLTFATEWTNQLDVTLGWLLSLDALLNRCDELTAALKKRGVRVREEGQRGRNEHDVVIVRTLPDASACFQLDLPLLWGQRSNDGPGTPSTWAEARDRLLFDLRDGFSIRWRELDAMDAVFADLADKMGESMMHTDVEGAARRQRAKLIQIRERAIPIAGLLDLPGVTEADLEMANARVRWDDIRPKPVPPADPRRWLREQDRLDLEAAEAGWAESLR